MRNWAVARVRSGCELQVCDEALSELSVEAYCPMFIRWRKLPKHIAKARGKTKELVKSVLFPGYVFVRIDELNELSRVAALREVFGFVSAGADICFADGSSVQTLKSMEVLGRNDDTVQGRKLRDSERLELMVEELQKISLRDWMGKSVRVAEGLFKGAFGVVDKFDDDEGTVEFSIGAVKLSMSIDSVLAA